MSDSVAQNLGPEAVLAALFTQAFSDGKGKLPAGITKADLRGALALEPSAQALIYEQIRANFRAAAFSAALPQTEVKPVGTRSWVLGVGAVLAMAWLAFITLPHPVPRVMQFLAGPVLTQPLLPAVQMPAPPHVLPVIPQVQEPVAKLLARAMQDGAALTELQNRAGTGEADAAYALASLLDSQRTQNEITVPKDDKAAFALYERAARAGNIEAEYAAGKAYQTGRGVTADAALATAWYRAAALSGYAPAQASLGFAYQTGLGIAQDAAQAALWFSRAADQSDPSAQTALGYLFVYGQGVPADPARGVALFNKAAAQHYGPAYLALGYSYAEGLGVPQDIKQAAEYFLQANMAGVPQAKTALQMTGVGSVRERLASCLPTSSAGD